MATSIYLQTNVVRRDDVMVVQMGARRAYELAQMLHQRGRLCCLQTDYAVHDSIDNLQSRMLRRLYPGIQALERRTVSGILPEQLYSAIAPNVAGRLGRAASLSSQLVYDIEDRALGFACRSRLSMKPAIILNTSGNGGYRFLSHAKSIGIKIVSDIVIVPQALEIEFAEQQKWPRWKEGAGLSESEVARYMARIVKLVEISDLLLCPSKGVVDGLMKFSRAKEKRLELIHYSLGELSPRVGSPKPGRILFAGSAVLRKGLPYLAQAAKILRKQGEIVDIRVAGDISPAIKSLPDCSGLTFLGKLSRKQIETELASTDVFCLPSLAEGMASATSEALSFGIPLVVTLQAGAPITNGIEGVIVPQGNSSRLADALRELTRNRALRDQMGEAALAKARELTPDRISARLDQILDNI